MKQYTIRGFDDLLVNSTQFRKLKTREKKLLLFDRCNWYISSIINHNLKEDKPYGAYVNLNSQILKKYLGDRNYKDIQKCLVGLGIIIENNKYSTNKFSKSFSLTKKAIKLGIEKTHTYSKKFNIKIKQLSEISYADINSNPTLKKILDNTTKTLVVEEPLHYLLNILPEPKYVETDNGLLDISEQVNQFRLDRYNAFYDSFFALNKITDSKVLFNSTIFYIPSIVSSGRIYHAIASMPKLIRESLRTKSNELIWEVDMCSAQPSIIFLEWLKNVKNNDNSNIKDEFKLCFKLLLGGNIYEHIQDNSTFFKGLNYNNLKKSVLTTFNAEDKPTEPNKELSRLFPNLMKWVNLIKKESGYKEISSIGQKAEANIFVEVYKKIPNDKFALIIHDCILIIKEDVVLVKELLEKRIRELYKEIILPEHNLDKLFKIDLVSIPDEKLQKNRREAYYKEYLEDQIIN
tara:strand:+ start:211 stop:1593 length:1383 start_codon:yes stop_codon:yes gene_type:complete